jgi:hypothetical protein
MSGAATGHGPRAPRRTAPMVCAALATLAGAGARPSAALAEPSALARRSAAAEPGEAIGVLEVATQGVSRAAGDKFEESVEEGLAGVGFRIVRSAAVQQRLVGSNYIGGCTFGPCMKEVLVRTGLRRVLVARIQGAGQSYSFIVSLVDTETGRLMAQVSQSCPVCTVEEAISTSTLAVIELLTARASETGTAAPADGARSGGAGDDAELERRGRQARRIGWIFAAGGAVALGVGGGLLAGDNETAGGAVLGIGGGLTAAALTALVWSSSF